jgi:tetratricopeptide (TPR) repeat protein
MSKKASSSSKKGSSTPKGASGQSAAELAGQIVNAVRALQEGLRGDAQSGAARLAAGKVYEIDNSLELAADFYARAGGDDVSFDEATARLAIVQLKMRRNERALETASGLIERAPEFTFRSMIKNKPLSALTVLGEALLANGLTEQATAAFRRALALQPGDTQAAARLCLLLVEEGKTDEASKALGQVEPNSGLFTVLNSAVSLASNDPSLLPSASRTALSSTSGWA